MKKIGKLAALLLTVSILAAGTGCGQKDGTDTPKEQGTHTIQKACMLLPGMISDQSFNYSAYLGLKEMENQGYEIDYTEAVGQNDSEAMFRTYATGGYDLIMGHGYSFVDAAVAVAGDYPDRYFYVYGSAPTDVAEEALPANTAFSYNKEYEGAYVCGVVAALESQTGRIGIVGGAPAPAQVANYNAFREGAKSVNSDIEVMIVVTGTFDDPAKGQEAAYSLIESGCDVIMHICDATGTGVIDVCVEKGIKVIGYGGDQRDLAPEQMLCCMGVDISKCISNQIEKIESNTFSGVQREGIAAGVIYITEFGSSCAQETIDRANEVIGGIADGTIVPEEITSGY